MLSKSTKGLPDWTLEIKRQTISCEIKIVNNSLKENRNNQI